MEYVSIVTLEMSLNNSLGELTTYLDAVNVPSVFCLQGFPGEVSLLPELVTLDLAFNQLSGPLPKEILKSMTMLDSLLLEVNHFNGTLPSAFFSMKGLRGFDVGENRCESIVRMIRKSSFSIALQQILTRLIFPFYSLTGTLSLPKTGMSEVLESAVLSRNHFSGTIPAEIASLTSLGE